MMGYTSAYDFAANADLDTALSWHFTANHYPPLPTSLIPAAKEAIDNALIEDWDAPIELPEGITYRDQATAPTHAVVEAWHLEAFIQAVHDEGFTE